MSVLLSLRERDLRLAERGDFNGGAIVMIVGVPKEIKQDEYRVAMLPVGVEELTRRGHKVLIEAGAGTGSGLLDSDYAQSGAEMIEGPDDIFARADMIVKVKEPQRVEINKIRKGQVVFTYFHLAADKE